MRSSREARTGTRCCVLRKVIEYLAFALWYSSAIILLLPVPIALISDGIAHAQSLVFTQVSEAPKVESESLRVGRKDRSVAKEKSNSWISLAVLVFDDKIAFAATAIHRHG
jgi:hypothetical protein